MNGNTKYWILMGLVVVVLFFILFRYRTCKKAGSQLGVPYRCKFFDSEPVTLIAEEHYYGKRDGKCYEFLDYGNNMQIRRVAMEHCGEKESAKKSEIVEDVEYMYDN